jgi:hypothetical protein
MALARPDCLIKLESVCRSLEFILANGERVLDMTISDVASLSGVSETTIFKLSGLRSPWLQVLDLPWIGMKRGLWWNAFLEMAPQIEVTSTKASTWQP